MVKRVLYCWVVLLFHLNYPSYWLGKFSVQVELSVSGNPKYKRARARTQNLTLILETVEQNHNNLRWRLAICYKAETLFLFCRNQKGCLPCHFIVICFNDKSNITRRKKVAKSKIPIRLSSIGPVFLTSAPQLCLYLASTGKCSPLSSSKLSVLQNLTKKLVLSIKKKKHNMKV